MGWVSLGQQVAAANGSRCAGLAGVKLEGAKVTSAVLVPAGAALADVKKLEPEQVGKLPAFCRVRVTDTADERLGY